MTSVVPQCRGHSFRSRRWTQQVGDVALYVVMWMVYDHTRGAADGLGLPLQVETARNIDRALFFGADPTVWMQRMFYSAEHVRWYDVAATIVYDSHFVVPVVAIGVLWVWRRQDWVRFMRRFATLLAGACVMFIVLPTAPPWMAGGGDARVRLDALPPLARPAGRGWDYFGVDSVGHLWETGRDLTNRTAALPSLHAAFALFVVIFLFPKVPSRLARAAMLVYPLTMGVVLVYLAEHYVIDVLAGWVFVVASFALWRRLECGGRDRAGYRGAVAVSDEDRDRWQRQVDALEAAECDDEGSPDQRVQIIATANRQRRTFGRPDLATEGEMHHRARALGLLDRVCPSPD